MNKLTLKFTIFLMFLVFTNLQAKEPYHVLIQSGPFKDSVSDPNLVDLTRSLKEERIIKAIPNYFPGAPLTLDFNIRGIKANSSFAANSTTLLVNIPQANITTSYTGSTREESLKLFREALRDGGAGHRLFKAYPKYSPIDPLAGNPNSLQAQMAQADYLLGTLSPLAGCGCFSAQPIVHQVQAGTQFGRSFVKGYDTTTVYLPLRYSYSPDLRWAFIIDAPLTYIRNGGASSIVGSLATGIRIPVLQQWSITPIIRMGAGGSLDLCTSGSFVSAGLNSIYNAKISSFVLSMTNYVGYFSTTNLWLSGVNFNYKLHNYIFKNGLSLTTCEPYYFCNKPLHFNVNFDDSYFARDRLYMRHFDEIGISLITQNINPFLEYDSLSLGFKYQFGDKNFKAYYANLIYQF